MKPDRKTIEAFALLDLGYAATASDAKKAFRKWIKAFHPDRFQDDIARQRAAAENLKKVILAYQTVTAYFKTATSFHPGDPAAPPPRPAPPRAYPEPRVESTYRRKRAVKKNSFHHALSEALHQPAAGPCVGRPCADAIDADTKIGDGNCGNSRGHGIRCQADFLNRRNWLRSRMRRRRTDRIEAISPVPPVDHIKRRGENR